MDPSTLRAQDSAPPLPHGERRGRIRHKLHSPAFASFNGPQTGMVLDLSEVLDLHEDGFCIHTTQPLDAGRAVSFCLDIPETKTYIHGSGQVIWSDGAGRGGVQFYGLSDQDRQRLRQWLFVNLLIACANHAARTQQLAQTMKEKPLESPPPQTALPVSVPDLSGMLSAVDAVRREVRAAGSDLGTVLPLIAERAMSLTGASGAALAYLTDDKMICRGRAGELAPPLGTPVDVKQGLSGECVRGGRMVACADTESDPRVDRELCQWLGIRSILAVPIVSDFRVVGLLEVFSPQAGAFTKTHETVLDRLAEVVPKMSSETLLRQDAATGELLPATAEANSSAHAIREALWEPETVEQEPLRGSLVRWVLLALAIAAAALALGYLLAPTIEKRWLHGSAGNGPAVVSGGPAIKQATTAANTNPGNTNTLEEVRKLAESGDPGAEYELGVRYHNGDGVPKSDVEAVKWFHRAAEQGHIRAQAALGAYYWEGRGVSQDLSKAYFWAVLARTGGDETSKILTRSMESQLTQAQATVIQQEAANWLSGHHETPQSSSQ